LFLQRDLERVAEEIKRIKASGAGAESGKSLRNSPKVVFLKSSGSSSSSALDRGSLLSRFPPHLSTAPLFIEAGSGYGEWVVR
jgi:hypothetical protein